MKKVLLFCLVFTLTLALSYGLTFALKSKEGDKLSGPHWQFNIIGKKKGGIGGDDSKGRTIMVPLKNVQDRTGMTCNVDGVEIYEPPEGTANILSSVPNNTRIYFDLCDDCGACDCNNFVITDRDATEGDNEARINVPETALGENNEIVFNIYFRVLGKPLGCMNINAYAWDADVGPAGGLWFYAGSAYISRKSGKSVFVKANDLFDVEYCSQVINLGAGIWICDSQVQTKSVFDSVFEEYFWNILNDGTKLVQVRIYMN